MLYKRKFRKKEKSRNDGRGWRPEHLLEVKSIIDPSGVGLPPCDCPGSATRKGQMHQEGSAQYWRYSLGVKHTGCSCREQEFTVWHAHGQLATVLASSPGGLAPSSDLLGHCIYVVHIHVYRQNSQTCKIKINKQLKKEEGSSHWRLKQKVFCVFMYVYVLTEVRGQPKVFFLLSS